MWKIRYTSISATLIYCEVLGAGVINQLRWLRNHTRQKFLSVVGFFHEPQESRLRRNSPGNRLEGQIMDYCAISTAAYLLVSFIIRSITSSVKSTSRSSQLMATANLTATVHSAMEIGLQLLSSLKNTIMESVPHLFKVYYAIYVMPSPLLLLPLPLPKPLLQPLSLPLPLLPPLPLPIPPLLPFFLLPLSLLLVTPHPHSITNSFTPRFSIPVQAVLPCSVTPFPH